MDNMISNHDIITGTTAEREVHDMMKMGVRAHSEYVRAKQNRRVPVKKRALVVLKIVAIAAVSWLVTLLAWQMK